MAQIPKEAMPAVEIPYLPISDFEESVLCEKYAQEPNEESEDLDIKINEKELLFSADKGLDGAVVLLLHGMKMKKYVKLFRTEKISLDTFLLLNEADLQELGIDEQDRKIIAKNLEIYQSRKNDLIVQENHSDDLQIARNVLNQLLLVRNYCAYMELQMKKHKLIDYKIDLKDSANVYLKAFTESAIVQSKKLSRSLFVESHQNHLIGKLLMVCSSFIKYDLSLPKHLQKKLSGKEKSYSSNILKTMVVIGFCSIVLLTGRHFLRRN